MDVSDWSLAELVYAAEMAEASRWDRIAVVCCLIANANRDPRRTRPFRPEDFHPMRAVNRARGAGADDPVVDIADFVEVLRNAERRNQPRIPGGPDLFR